MPEMKSVPMSFVFTDFFFSSNLLKTWNSFSTRRAIDPTSFKNTRNWAWKMTHTSTLFGNIQNEREKKKEKMIFLVFFFCFFISSYFIKKKKCFRSFFFIFTIDENFAFHKMFLKILWFFQWKIQINNT